MLEQELWCFVMGQNQSDKNYQEMAADIIVRKIHKAGGLI